MKLRAVGLALALFAVLAAEGRGQVVWDSPMLLPPLPSAEMGIYLVDPAGSGLGAMGTYRAVPGGMGLRLGIADADDGIALFGGLDVLFNLARVTPEFPVDISWFTGVGAGFSDWVVVSVPLGLTLGHTFVGPDVRLTPYAAPRLDLDAHLGDVPGGSELSLRVGVDLGFDLAVQAGWMIRIGAGIGDRSGLAVGVVF
jgi:hypothetical protein